MTKWGTPKIKWNSYLKFNSEIVDGLDELVVAAEDAEVDLAVGTDGWDDDVLGRIDGDGGHPTLQSQIWTNITNIKR